MKLYTDSEGADIHVGDLVHSRLWWWMPACFGYARNLEPDGRLRITNSMGSGFETMQRFVKPTKYVLTRKS